MYGHAPAEAAEEWNKATAWDKAASRRPQHRVSIVGVHMFCMHRK